MEKNKKANVMDIITAIGLFFMIILVVMFMWKFNTTFEANIKTNNATNYTQLNSFMDTYNERYVKGWDYGFLLLAVLLPIFSYIAARKIPSDSIYMIMTYFFIGFIVLFCMIFSNIYGQMIENATIAEFIAQTKYIPLIMPNLPYYGMIYLLIVCIGLYQKTNETQ